MYSWPFMLVPMALPRQMNQMRGQFSAASGSSTAKRRPPLFSWATVY